MIKRLTIGILAAAAGGALGSPVQAQSGTLVIYGNDKCPSNTICVRAPESERYRIPQVLRDGPLPPSEQPWSSRARSVATAGASGTGSCSASGAGGNAGCWSQMMADAKAQKRADAAAAAQTAEPK